MSVDPLESSIPFSQDDWVIDTANGQKAQYTGRARKVGSHVMVELRYADGSVARRPLGAIRIINPDTGTSVVDQLRNNAFGKLRDIQRLITFQKLKGTLHEVVYSMEAAQIDFYAYQFKPVLKFINSPTERLIIADEVGLGKTIESALIWTELQARRQAKRLLVVCPKILTEKWREELRTKFLFDARVVDFRNLQQEVTELKKVGPIHPFVLIASYSGLRPPKAEIDLLRHPPDQDKTGTAKTRFLRDIRHWNFSYSPFDLVIFDEAHYMRNAATSAFNLGESLSAHDNTAVLCVSATPINNSNNDLRSLLRLIDSDFFETQGMFEELLEVNRPTVRAINTLSRPTIDMKELEEEVAGMARSTFIKDSPLFEQLLVQLDALEANPQDKAILAKAQDSAEKLNLLGNYVNRTRRIQVEGKRPKRRVRVLQVQYSKEEMTLYKTILELVRRLCRRDMKPFHVFRVLGLQLRAASCLPAIAEDIRNGRLGGLRGSVDEMNELLAESVGDEVYEEYFGGVYPDIEFETPDLLDLVSYDFEANDSKYDVLRELLQKTAAQGEKIVIFAYYIPTLTYLRRRLRNDGFDVAVIHGGIEHEQRWVELDRFKDTRGPSILLSSEVGSEGIDLQFSSRLVNYDLPWNPMKVEQRIGRIDRVGQKAEVLSIFNFKVDDTVEERLYTRLHEKLLRFSNSLGDLETIIGEQIQSLTIELLSRNLTLEEEQERMDHAAQVIERELLTVRELEDSGEALVALSDYVQKKIKEDHEKGRFLQAHELEDYLADFFERNYPGTELSRNTPADGCMRMRLSYDAQSSLADFIRNDHSLSARPLRQREFAISFQREAVARLPLSQRRFVTFINHLSPLIRWITQLNEQGDHDFHKVSAIEVKHPNVQSGVYMYRIERWFFKGLTSRGSLNYAVMNMESGEVISEEISEQLIQNGMRIGSDWDYAKWSDTSLMDNYNCLVDAQLDRLDEAFSSFEAENDTTVQIRVRRASNHWDRLIRQSEQAIQTMIAAGRKESQIRSRRTRLSNERENKEQRLAEIKKGAETSPHQEEIAAGIIRVTNSN
ncbi:MAG: SNF2-related protein [Flavobacteriaceae bacterium]